jgi:D-alanine-D-alanine ligase-like ATP-grasp enzyme
MAQITLTDEWRRLNGYAHGLPQQPLLGRIRVHSARPQDLPALDALLLRVVPSTALPDPQGDASEAFARRFFFWVSEIQRHARVAVSPDLHLRPITADRGGPVFEVALPCRSMQASRLTMRWLEKAVNHALGRSPTRPTPLDGSLNQLLEQLKAHAEPGYNRLHLLLAAYRLGLPVQTVATRMLRLGTGARARLMHSSLTDLTPALGLSLAQDKWLTSRMLAAIGIPATRNDRVKTADEAVALAHRLGWPVVVKPVDGERGEGVSVDVADEPALRTAFAAALAKSGRKAVLVERLVPGVCHRIFIAEGQLLYAVKRMPMSVQGDGARTVAQLVDAEVAQQQRLPPWTRSGIQPLDDAARGSLSAAGLSAESVPGPGRWVALRRIESTLDGGVDEEVTQQIHPENLRVALACAELFGLGMAGIDIISSDITQPWFDNGAIVNEVNFAPLLGGAPISRSHLPAFLRRFIGGTGMIPVEVYAGGEAAWATATQRWSALRGQGVKACLSNARQTLAPSGHPWPLRLTGLHARVRSLIVSAQVEALVLVVQDDEFLHTGLPLEAVSTVTVVDEALTVMDEGAVQNAPPTVDIGTAEATPAVALAPARVAALRELLQKWRRQTVDRS